MEPPSALPPPSPLRPHLRTFSGSTLAATGASPTLSNSGSTFSASTALNPAPSSPKSSPRVASDGLVPQLKAYRDDVCGVASNGDGEDKCGDCGGPAEELQEGDVDVSIGKAGGKFARKRASSSASAKGSFDRFGLPSEQSVLGAEHSFLLERGHQADFASLSLLEAGDCELVGESGSSVLFSTLVRERERVVVVFLRHLWCGLCQSYVVALKSASKSLSSLSTTALSTVSSTSGDTDPPQIHKTNFSLLPPLYILLISSGSPSLIPIYRARLECPFPLYVDQSRKLYKILGMTRKTWDGGRESEKGTYAKRSGLGNVVASTIVRDLFAAAGVEISQEDAESIFGDGTHGGAP
ncbi:hypothetical protein P7C70_g3378, partial [Phenoliferia sp. Uapishka_3]